MKILFYSKDAQFELTDDEFQKALIAFDSGKRIYIERLGVSLSPMYIWAGEKPTSRRKLHDGGYAVKKDGYWVLESDTNIRLDLKYYPELSKDIYDNKNLIQPAKNDSYPQIV